jgi:hypothetical protein
VRSRWRLLIFLGLVAGWCAGQFALIHQREWQAYRIWNSSARGFELSVPAPDQWVPGVVADTVVLLALAGVVWLLAAAGRRWWALLVPTLLIWAPALGEGGRPQVIGRGWWPWELSDISVHEQAVWWGGLCDSALVLAPLLIGGHALVRAEREAVSWRRLALLLLLPYAVLFGYYGWNWLGATAPPALEVLQLFVVITVAAALVTGAVDRRWALLAIAAVPALVTPYLVESLLAGLPSLDAERWSGIWEPAREALVGLMVGLGTAAYVLFLPRAIAWGGAPASLRDEASSRPQPERVP